MDNMYQFRFLIFYNEFCLNLKFLTVYLKLDKILTNSTTSQNLSNCILLYYLTGIRQILQAL